MNIYIYIYVCVCVYCARACVCVCVISKIIRVSDIFHFHYMCNLNVK